MEEGCEGCEGTGGSSAGEAGGAGGAGQEVKLKGDKPWFSTGPTQGPVRQSTEGGMAETCTMGRAAARLRPSQNTTAATNISQ